MNGLSEQRKPPPEQALRCSNDTAEDDAQGFHGRRRRRSERHTIASQRMDAALGALALGRGVPRGRGIPLGSDLDAQ